MIVYRVAAIVNDVGPVQIMLDTSIFFSWLTYKIIRQLYLEKIKKFY